VEIVPDERSFVSRHFVNCFFSGAFSLRFRVNGVISRELRVWVCSFGSISRVARNRLDLASGVSGVSGVLILVLRWVKLEQRFEAATLETKWEKHHAMDRTCF
jgi:hypothetical protein